MDRREFILKGSIVATAISASFGARATERSTAPVVRTKQGLLEGFAIEGVNKFLGVPFALPPIGDLRWRAPRAPAAWSGTRKAQEFSPAAYQLPINPSFRTD